MTEFIRQATHYYNDPLSRVWIACAEAVGFRIVRTPDAYASTDGKGTLLIAVDEMFDPDDSLAQMIFHELCHALVEGEDGESKLDWGIGYAIGNNPWREHAALRLQAYLAGQVGLRDFFAPTTDFRVSFWNAMPVDPFYAPPELGGRRERSCVAARLAAWRATLSRWAKPLNQALSASAAIAAATPRIIPSEASFCNSEASLPFDRCSPNLNTVELSSTVPSPNGGGLGWGQVKSVASLPFNRPPPNLPPLGGGINSAALPPNLPPSEGKTNLTSLPSSPPPSVEKGFSLWSTVQVPPVAHPSGHSPVADHFSGFYCADCAWGFVERHRLRCRHAPSMRLPDDSPACWRYEPAQALDCLSCGACCREAYHAVEISRREPVNKRHPKLVVIQDSRRKLLRNGKRCAALSGGEKPTETFACDIYEDRPRTCREFTLGSENCLDARRRVGLSL